MHEITLTKFSNLLDQFQQNLTQRTLKMKGVHVCSNDGLRPYPRGDNYEMAKIHRRNSKIFFRTTERISTKLDTKQQSWVFTKRAHRIFKTENVVYLFISLLI